MSQVGPFAYSDTILQMTTIRVLLSVTTSCESLETPILGAPHPIHATTAKLKKKSTQSTARIYLTYFITSNLEEIACLCLPEHSGSICYLRYHYFHISCCVSGEALPLLLLNQEFLPLFLRPPNYN